MQCTIFLSSLHAPNNCCTLHHFGNASRKAKKSSLARGWSLHVHNRIWKMIMYCEVFCFTGSLFTNLRNLVRLSSAEGLPGTEVVRRSMCSGRLGSVGPESAIPHHVRCAAVSSRFARPV